MWETPSHVDPRVHLPAQRCYDTQSLGNLIEDIFAPYHPKAATILTERLTERLVKEGMRDSIWVVNVERVVADTSGIILRSVGAQFKPDRVTEARGRVVTWAYSICGCEGDALSDEREMGSHCSTPSLERVLPAGQRKLERESVLAVVETERFVSDLAIRPR
jgi:hypothetical protein